MDHLQTILDGLSGHLSPTARVWTALAPALVIMAWFLIGFAIFSYKSARTGPIIDAETVKRGDSLLIGAYVRHFLFWLLKPIDKALFRSGIPADGITTLAVLVGLASGVALAAGRFALGGWLFIASGILDTLDGRVARARGQVTAAGGALDSVLDRYADSAVLVGLAWYYRDSWILLLVLAALVGSSLVPYVRAKSEALGFQQKDGLMGRAERVVYMGVATALSPVLEALVNPSDPHPRHWLAVGGIGLVAVLSNVTAMQRLTGLLRALSPPKPPGQRSPKAILLLSGLAAVLATGLDYAAVIGLVELAALTPAVATLLGSLLGGAANFALNRLVTFRSDGRLAGQAARYAFISASSALLNAGGVAVLALHPEIDYRVAWWLVRGAVWLAWNLPMQRDFVFAVPSPQGSAKAA